LLKKEQLQLNTLNDQHISNLKLLTYFSAYYAGFETIFSMAILSFDLFRRALFPPSVSELKGDIFTHFLGEFFFLD